MLFNYTDTLQHIFESYPVNRDEYLTNKQVIENGRPLLFDFDYPIFDANYKNVFETNFIRNFYVRQIGFESYGLFKFQLETWLNINMPYFNKLFESELIKYDPLINYQVDEKDTRNVERVQGDVRSKTATKDVDISSTANKTQNVVDNKTENGSTTGTNTSESNSLIGGTSESTNTGSTKNSKTTGGTNTSTNSGFNRELETDTPQNRLAITTNDGSGVIEYASGIKERNDKTNQTSTSSGTEEGSQTNTDKRNETSSVDSKTTGSDNTTVSTANEENKTVTDTSNVIESEKVLQGESHSENYGSNIKTIDDYISSKGGKIGTQTYASMVNEYRSALLRIERQIFKEMNELFMLVY